MKEENASVEELRESEFSYQTLNDYFWNKGWRKACTQEIDGVLVTKTLTPYSSNSGKSRDFSVSYSWTGCDGVLREANKKSSFEANRRSDPERNWGLHN